MSNNVEFDAFNAENLEPLREFLQSDPYVVSQEMLLCPDYGKVPIGERLRRLGILFEGAKVLIVTRRQIDYLKSFHKIALKGLGMSLSQREYVSLYADNRFLGYTGVLDYFDMLSTLQNLGFEVSWIPYELLLHNPAEFLETLQDVLDGDLDCTAVDHHPINAGEKEDRDLLRWLYNKQNPHFLSGDLYSFPIAESFLHSVRGNSPLASRIQAEMQRSATAWNLKEKHLAKNSEALGNIDRELWRSGARLDSRLMELYAESNRRLDSDQRMLGDFGYY